MATKASKPKPKYKLHQYLVGKDSVYLKIVGILTDNVAETVYALQNPKDNKVRWSTETEIQRSDPEDPTRTLSVGVPDFAAYRKLKVNDIIKTGTEKQTGYVVILARVGDMVLTSMQPTPREQTQKVSKLADQIASLTDDTVEIIDANARKQLREASSFQYNKHVADDWEHVDKLCLMNWPIVSE